MSDVSINYKGAEIASLDDSGMKTLLTSGKYCEDNIEVAYIKPSGGGTRTKWYRPPDWPDITSLSFPSTHGSYFVLDTDLLPSNRTFAVNLGITNGRKAALGHIENGEFVEDYTYTASGVNSITIPEEMGRYVILYLIGGVAGGGSQAPAFVEPPLPPIVEAYIKYKESFTYSPISYNSSNNTLFLNTQAMTIIGAIGLSGLAGRIYSNKSRLRYLSLTGHFYVLSRALYSICQNMYGLAEIQFNPDNTITLDTTSQSNWPNSAFQNCHALRSIDLSFCDASAVTQITQMFDYCYSLETLNLDGWDLSSCTKVTNTFRQCISLKNISLVGSTLPSANISFAQSSVLSDASLVGIANALPAGAYTLTLHATPKAACSTIMGTVDNDVFTADESGTVTLADFITQTKGWTLA